MARKKVSETIRKQIVSDLADGTSKLTISPDMFDNYYIEYVPYDKQQAFVKTKLKKLFRASRKIQKSTRAAFARYSKPVRLKSLSLAIVQKLLSDKQVGKI